MENNLSVVEYEPIIETGRIVPFEVKVKWKAMEK